MSEKAPVTKTVEQWERDFGVVFLGTEVDLTEELTQEQFTSRVYSDDYPTHSIDYKSRTEWLEYNGYEVTRANLVADLSTIVTPPELLIDEAPSKTQKS